MKSHASDQVKLAELIYLDASARCIAVSSFDRRMDINYIRRRVKLEGLSFLTITLPTFARDLERSLENGRIDSTLFRSFRKCGLIPAFLRGITCQLFDGVTGLLLQKVQQSPKESACYVDAIRQICLAFKKLELECTSERTYKAIVSFEQTEQELAEFEVTDATRANFALVASLVWTPIVSSLELESMVPSHGPGTTSEGLSGNQKYLWKFWNERLEPYFPFLAFGYNVSAADSEEFGSVTFLSPDRELPSRVIPVPKTLKAPRIIAAEPCSNVYIQQAIRKSLYEAVESGRWVSGHVNFTDQSINQQIAIRSSSDGQMATFDLSDASDRVINSIAMTMFDSHPALRDAIQACRTTMAQLPNGRIIGPLRKFASMGNALCFPVEAMYFYTICVEALILQSGRPVDLSSVRDACSKIYVYGDDIIVPSTNAITVRDNLQKYKCKVNTAKSFWNGSFRESCGADAFGGQVVTPVYLRSVLPSHRRQASECISTVATANQFYLAGMWRTASYLFNRVEKILGQLPYVSDTSSALGRVSLMGFRSAQRWNRFLHRFELLGWCPSPVHRTDELEGYAAQMKCQLLPTSDPDGEFQRSTDHLLRTARSGSVTLKRRWVGTYD